MKSSNSIQLNLADSSLRWNDGTLGLKRKSGAANVIPTKVGNYMLAAPLFPKINSHRHSGVSRNLIKSG
jgi:hypothetical protein